MSSKAQEEQEAKGWSSIPDEAGHPWSTPTTWPLGGRSSVGLVVTDDGDAALAAAGFAPSGDLWPGQSQQTIGRQGAGDC